MQELLKQQLEIQDTVRETEMRMRAKIAEDEAKSKSGISLYKRQEDRGLLKDLGVASDQAEALLTTNIPTHKREVVLKAVIQEMNLSKQKVRLLSQQLGLISYLITWHQSC